jgi:fructose-1,6-bisphosphatase II
MERTLSLEFVRVTEAAALAAARCMGKGDGHAADRAAVEAMRKAMDAVDIAGTIVIGEGERDEAPMLYIGERVGGNHDSGWQVDIAVDPLEGTNLVAKGLPNAICVLAAAEQGGLLHAPDVYMEKLIVGRAAAGKVSLDSPVEENLGAIARSLGRGVEDITVIILDRPRHADLIRRVREAGARIKLIPDGDLTAAISVAVSGTGVHAVMGIGGAPEGVLAAAALRCLGGEILGRFWCRNDEERDRCRAMGVDPDRVYRTRELASGERLIFAATGVTSGDLLRGVNFFGGGARTNSIVMGAESKTIRFVDTIHILQEERVERIRL